MARNVSKSFAQWFYNPFEFDTVTYNNGTQDEWTTYYYTYPKEITKQVDSFFNQFWEHQGKPLVGDNAKLPRTNAYEAKDGMHIECFIPFASKDDINITLDPVMNAVRVEVEAHQDEEENKDFHLKEISRTSMKRTFMLDKRFDVPRAEGNFENGVLSITVPYSKENEKKTLTLK